MSESTSRGAWIVTREFGEYSDHSMKVLCVTEAEDAARAAAEHFARECAARESFSLGVYVARPTNGNDARHGDGFWVVVDADRDDADDEYRGASTYSNTFGFFFAEAFVPPTK